MKNIDQATTLTIQLAKLLIGEMQSLEIAWEKAFLRIEVGDGYQECKGSYVLLNGVQLFDVFKHKPMFAAARQLASDLRDAGAKEGRKFVVALLIVDSGFNFEVQYEYEDHARWAITKLGGASGLPEGYVA